MQRTTARTTSTACTACKCAGPAGWQTVRPAGLPAGLNVWTAGSLCHKAMAHLVALMRLLRLLTGTLKSITGPMPSGEQYPTGI